MKKVNTKYLFNRKGIYYFRKVVPKHLVAEYDTREIVRTLKTSSLNEAIIMVATLAAQYEAEFKAGNVPQIDLSISALKATAQTMHATYSHPDLYADASIEKVIEATGAGIEAIGRIPNPTRIQYAAIGGIEKQPALTMRQAWEQYEEHNTEEFADATKSKRQLQKVKNKYINAVKEWEGLMGTDVDVLKLTKKVVYDYRAKLLLRLNDQPADESKDEEAKAALKADTLRKKLMWLRKIVRHSFELADLGESPFENLRKIKGNGREEKRKTIYEAEVIAIRKEFAKANANDELVAIMAVIENTGTSAQEVVLLQEGDIHLNAPIPFIEFKANDMRSMLKTDSRARSVPLLGIALEAMKRFPKGFPRYCRDGGAEALGAAANKLIQKVAPDKGSYGYRHRMANLMKAKGIEDSLQDSIMGHSGDGKMTGYYGEEYPLSVKAEVLRKVLPEHAYQTQL